MAIAAARSVFRSSTVRSAATRLASQAKSVLSSPFRLPSRTPRTSSSHLPPYHSVTASALMTSRLTLSRFGYRWLPEGI